MKSLSDEQLIAAFKNGKSEAFDELYGRYRRYIEALAHSFFLVGGDVEDLRQEGMMGLFYSVTGYDAQKGTFSTYSYMCIKSRMLNAVTASNAGKHKALNDSVSISVFDAEKAFVSPPPEDVVIGSESLKELTEKIKDVLSPFEIKVFKLYIEGANYKEIAVLLAKSPKSVDNAIQRIKEKSKKFRSN